MIFLYFSFSTILLIRSILVVHPPEEVFFEVTFDGFRVHKVAESAKDALSFFVLATFGLSKIGHERIFGVELPAAIKLPIHRFHAILRLRFTLEFDVCVTNNVVSNIVSNDYFVNLAKLGKLLEHFLIEVFKVFNRGDQVFIRDVASVRVSYRSLRVLVHVLKNERLRKIRLIVQASACVSMPTRPNFVIKWTIYSENIQTKNMVRKG